MKKIAKVEEKLFVYCEGDLDCDRLSDIDEVDIWVTDPHNPDTDGDNLLDGDEVNNGYNPSGSGKIFQVYADIPNGGNETGAQTTIDTSLLEGNILSETVTISSNDALTVDSSMPTVL